MKEMGNVECLIHDVKQYGNISADQFKVKLINLLYFTDVKVFFNIFDLIYI